jgi:hypothetical protein
MKVLVDISVHSLDEGTRHLISDAASDEIAVVFPRSQEEIIRTGGDAQVITATVVKKRSHLCRD